MDITFLNQADTVTLNLELTKRALETAKTEFDLAKQAFDDLMNQADIQGISKNKFKLFMEERVKALVESGLLTSALRTSLTTASHPEVKRTRKIKKGTELETAENSDVSKNPAVLDGEIAATFV